MSETRELPPQDTLKVSMSYSLPPSMVIWLAEEAARRGYNDGRGNGASRLLREILDAAKPAWDSSAAGAIVLALEATRNA